LTRLKLDLSENKQEIKEEEEFKKAKGIALRILARCSRSSKELKERLIQKGFDSQVIERVLVFLNDRGYLNDLDYAQRLAMRLLENKKVGFARIEAILKERGIPPEFIAAVLSQLKENYSEIKTAFQIMERRFSNFEPQRATIKERNRVIRFLQQRGFSWETIAQVLKK